MGFSVVTLASYDWLELFESIPPLLPHVDEVIVGVDKDRLTWSGTPAELPADLAGRLRALEGGHKIQVVEESFHRPELTPMECETRERNLLAQRCRPGNWIVSIDADEVVLNPAGFFAELAQAAPDSLVFASWATVFKQVERGLVLVAAQPGGQLETFPVATRLAGAFARARYTNQASRTVSRAIFLHNSWGRREEGVLQKLAGWGHSRDFDSASFFAFWKSVDRENHDRFRNCHPLQPKLWPALRYVPLGEVNRIDRAMLRHPMPRSLRELVRYVSGVFRATRDRLRGRA